MDYAVEVGVNAIKEDRSELEVLAIIEHELKTKGIHKMSFDTMVLAGANSALPHGIPGANKMKRGDFVLFDLGVIIDGYCSDITRTVAFGEISEEQTRIYNTVLAGQLQAVEDVNQVLHLAQSTTLLVLLSQMQVTETSSHTDLVTDLELAYTNIQM